MSLRKSVLDYARDVERMIACLKLEKSSYDAYLFDKIGPPRYPALPFATPLGDGTLRVLGADSAVFEADDMVIYRVAYRVHAFVKRIDDAWHLESGIRVLMRRDRVSAWDESRAARERFAKVALPVIAGALDSGGNMAIVRDAAQRERLAWEIADRYRDVRRIDELLGELQSLRSTITSTASANRSEIRAVKRRLARASGSAAA